MGMEVSGREATCDMVVNSFWQARRNRRRFVIVWMLADPGSWKEGMLVISE